MTDHFPQVTLFPLGGVNWLVTDFHGPDVTDEETKERLKAKHKNLGAAIKRVIISLNGLLDLGRTEVERDNRDNEKVAPPLSESDLPIPSVGLPEEPVSAVTTIAQHTAEMTETTSETLRYRLARIAFRFLRTLITPCSLSIILAFIVSIVPVLKALFVPDVLGVSISPAPDGQPPLAILLNTATFIGGASVPLGLMNLGSALARLEIPDGRLHSLPLGAVSALAIGRLVIMPVLGVLITQGLTQIGLLDVNDKVLRFVCMYVNRPS